MEWIAVRRLLASGLLKHVPKPIGMIGLTETTKQNTYEKENNNMIVKALYGWLNRDKAPDIVSLTKIIIAAMAAAKTAFPTPTPALALVEAAIAAVEVAIADAADGSREMRAILRVKLAELVSLMRQLAVYVTLTANGDMAVLISSG